MPLTEHQVLKGRIVGFLWKLEGSPNLSTENKYEKNKLLNNLGSFHFCLQRSYKKNQYLDFRKNSWSVESRVKTSLRLWKEWE